jgi:ABC-type dipeptide/oligopeptide/nickel transport system permease component
LAFALSKALPGDPVYSMVGERSSPEIIEKIRREIGSDKGIMRQYAGYLALLSQGELGRSYYTNRSVLDDIRAKGPNTLLLAVSAMLLAVPLGLALGFISGLREGSVTDKIITAASISGLSFPVFWLGLLLMFLVSLKLRLLPPSGMGDYRYLILPSLTLSLPAMSVLARVTRVTVIDIRSMSFVRTAKAKGLRDLSVNAVHILRNALIPVITVIGLEFGSYLNGAVLTETIFGWDGIGRFTVEGIMKRDYPVIMGCVLTGTMVFTFINLCVDVIYHYIDPRVRVHGTNR